MKEKKKKLAKEREKKAKLEKERKRKDNSKVVSNSVADEIYSIEGNIEGDIQVSNILKRVNNPDEAQKELNNISKTIEMYIVIKANITKKEKVVEKIGC